eukprot:CAMPEP_0172507894 /NCGR_PEP_ID=MMETSP1066-20121228/207319_1 /TAXON_ID=671091 /ORGANISM="Coscinodiscus wailesii, Strain CCMP2513" /LENGTH=445 /DNA_ID=CAMNT_0013285605 /DNA_START=1 /DNA_END=1338 /DNA_ORIENTATION=-
MVSVKGFSKYFWAFERKTSDSVGNSVKQNLLGFHDSSFYVRIQVGDDATASSSGYDSDGWDWCHIPGATTHLIPIKKLWAMDSQLYHSMQRPYGSSTFVGGVNMQGQHGLFVMDYTEITLSDDFYWEEKEQPKLTAMKALFAFDEEIVVVTDKVNAGRGKYKKYKVGTTIFQTALKTKKTPTWAQNTKYDNISKRSVVIQDKNIALVDAVGNAYYVPDAAGKVHVRRSRQKSRDYTGKSSRGYHATAWFDHGKKPNDDFFYYIILPAQAQRVTTYEPEKRIDVVQHGDDGIIVHHKLLNVTGYALPKSNTELRKGIIKEVSVPCLVMTETNFKMEDATSHIKMSVVNPDLGWGEPGMRYEILKADEKYETVPTDPVITHVILLLHGSYSLSSETYASVVDVTYVGEVTELNVTTVDGLTSYFELKCVSLEVCKRVYTNQGIALKY